MSGVAGDASVNFQGGVFSPYLTSRLPAWAGVRQNVVGSNLDGRPVAPANSSTLTYATVGASPLDTAAAAAASAAASTARVLAADLGLYNHLATTAAVSRSVREDSLQLVLERLDVLARQLEELSAKVADLASTFPLPPDDPQQ